jgi:hypothetical protein
MAADDRISGRIQEGITETFAVKDIRGFCEFILFYSSINIPLGLLSF